MTDDEQGKAMGKIVAKAWADEDFKAKLLADPSSVLKVEGIKVPAGVLVNIVENTDKVTNLVLPANPTDLSDDDMDAVVGGAIVWPPVGGTF